jgi:DNA-binding SARP family transcriptional activator
VQVLVLGPVRAVRDGQDLDLNGPRERAVLAALALAGPGGIDTERLVDQVWGEDPPRTAARTVQAYLSRLRAALGTGVIVSEARRHRLATADVDVWRFRELSSRADGGALREAVALWRDPAPACDASLDGAVIELAALARARIDTAESLLAHLDDPEVVPAAERILAEEPHRELVWLRLAEALYRLGRAADALDTVRRAQRHLVTDLGLDPSPALVALEGDLLNHRIPERCSTVAPPVPLTSIVGRTGLLAEIGDRLRDHRLVTLVGTGGIGKTRLAIAAAPEQACFAALSGATTARAVENTVLTAVGADRDRDDVVAALVARFERRGALVVLDNCEHVVTVAAALVRPALARCPGVRFWPRAGRLSASPARCSSTSLRWPLTPVTPSPSSSREPRR